MPTINFPGGATFDAGSPEYFFTDGGALTQDNVFFPVTNGDSPSTVRKNLNNLYTIKIHSISPDAVEVYGDIFVRYRGGDYSVGSILTFSELVMPYNFCTIIISDPEDYESSYFKLGNLNTPGAFQNFLFGGSESYPRALSGTWTWTTAPTAPSVSTALNGTNVTVTRGTSTTDSQERIVGYVVQRRESVDGTTWGSWANNITLSTTTFTHTYTGLTPGKYYQFRVYANNDVVSSEATVSGTILIPSITRYTGTAFIAPDNLKRYDGSAWQNITQVKRWNGTSWVTIDITGINST